MWPSQNKEINLKKKKPISNIVLETYSDNDDDEGEIDWLNLPVKKPNN